MSRRRAPTPKTPPSAPEPGRHCPARHALPALLAACVGGGAAAADPLVGLWTVIDDRDHMPRALLRITEHDGEFRARVERGLRPIEQERPVCDNCPDERRGQPMLGLTIVTGLKRDGEVYRGGEILDPDNGRIYSCQMVLRDEGQRLEVRGYLGTPMLGRTQVWLRAPEG